MCKISKELKDIEKEYKKSIYRVVKTKMKTREKNGKVKSVPIEEYFLSSMEETNTTIYNQYMSLPFSVQLRIFEDWRVSCQRCGLEKAVKKSYYELYG